jgi:ABC-type branched-subunit amino acid transport system substrate-binding protein
VPLITNFHIPMFSDSGDPEFDHNKDPYYFRIDPSDSLAGIAMAYWGYKHYGTKAVTSFTNDPGAQTTVPSLLAEYRRLGGTIVHNQALVPHQTSYRTEILTLLGDHPKVVFTEMDPQTAGTFWGEVRQLDNGTTPPVLATTLATKSAYIQAVTGAIGSSLFGSHFAAVSPLNPVGPSYASFKAALLKEGSAVRNPGQYLSDPYTIADYDSVIVASLAMTEAKSTTPSVWRPFILKVAGSGSGSTLVHTYTAGLQAIHAGKSVSYVGAYGPFYFNRYQNASGEFAIFRWNPATHTDKQVGLVTLREMQALTGS